MTPLEAFAAIENHYLAIFKPRVDALQQKLSDAEIVKLCYEIIDLTNDDEVDGKPFPIPANTILDGNDAECVVNTVLDTTQPSLVYLPYRQMRVCCFCIISILEDKRRGDWFKKWLVRYDFPFQSATIENCITQLQSISETLHAKNGAFAQAKTLAEKGKWHV